MFFFHNRFSIERYLSKNLKKYMPYVKQHIMIFEKRHFCNHTLYDERKSTHGKTSRMTVISAVCENIFARTQ